MAYADALPATPPAPRADGPVRKEADDRVAKGKEFAALVGPASDKSVRDPAPSAKQTPHEKTSASDRTDPATSTTIADIAAPFPAGKPDAGASDANAMVGKAKPASEAIPGKKALNKAGEDAASTTADDGPKAVGAPALIVQFIAPQLAKAAGAADAGPAKAAPSKSVTADAGASLDAAEKGATGANATAAAPAAPASNASTASPTLAPTPAPIPAPNPVTGPASATPPTSTAASVSTPASTSAVAPLAAAAARADKAAAPASTSVETGPGARRAEANGDVATTANAPAGQTAQDQSPTPAHPAAAQTREAMAQAAAAGDTTSKPQLALEAAKAVASAAADAGGSGLLAASEAARSTATPQAQTASASAAQVGPATMQVATRFIERFDGRAQRFEVRLDPAELGRVDIRIEVGADKKVHAVLAAHDSAALSDLMRGSKALEKALGDAGIDIADGGLKFELATDAGNLGGGQNRSSAWNGSDQPTWPRGPSRAAIPVDADTATLATTSTPRSRRGASRFDLMA